MSDEMDPTPNQHDARYKLCLFADMIHQAINRRPKIIAVERETARALGIPDNDQNAKIYGIEVCVINPDDVLVDGSSPEKQEENDFCDTCNNFGLPNPCPGCGLINKGR